MRGRRNVRGRAAREGVCAWSSVWADEVGAMFSFIFSTQLVGSQGGREREDEAVEARADGRHQGHISSSAPRENWEDPPAQEPQ